MKQNDYFSRIEKMYFEMDQHNLDYLFVFSDVWRPGNTFCLTGWAIGGGGVSQAWTLLILEKNNNNPKYIVGYEFVPSAEAVLDERITVLPSNQIDDILAELTATSKKIGIVGGEILYSSLYKTISTRFVNSKFVDANQILYKHRRIKSSDEIKMIKESHRVTDSAILEVMNAIEIGISEKELAAKGMAKIHEMGGLLGFYPTVAIGSNSANAMQMSTKKTIIEDSMILIDFGTNFNGYFSDCTRTAGYKLHDDNKKNIIHTCIKTKNEVKAILKPGMRSIDIEKFIRDRIIDAGYGEYIVHNAGHGIGTDQEEPFAVNLESDILIEKGMTFTLEPGIYVPGVGGCRIEEMIFVTDNGCESFSELNDDWFY